MIWVTRLNGSGIVVNADLVETVEATPDTVVTLVDGKKYVVHESPDEIVERVMRYRASVLQLADEHEDRPGASLYVLPAADERRAD